MQKSGGMEWQGDYGSIVEIMSILCRNTGESCHKRALELGLDMWARFPQQKKSVPDTGHIRDERAGPKKQKLSMAHHGFGGWVDAEVG